MIYRLKWIMMVSTNSLIGSLLLETPSRKCVVLLGTKDVAFLVALCSVT